MLSTENPPPDPPCPCEISQLKSSDERASDKVALEEVDLLNSGLDDNNPLPKFSIRDYVFGVRSKDINTNWPFSQKNLQLCLKHGVKDLLPPFQPLDSVRNLSVIKRCVTEAPLLDKEYIGNSDGGPSRPSDHFDTFNKKLALDCVNINSSGSEGDKEFQSTITSQSQSEIDSVPTNRTPCLALETDNFLEGPVPAPNPEGAGSPASQKSETTAQPPVKKCRLIVKLSNNSDPCVNEDFTSNYMTFSETMASKVCPVCKTFSSSSNTTLNAHIDQCLSVESTIKWTANAKVIKHRIKPRKTRLMEDIYATAPQSTLEDLDRRNGTNWAIMAAQETGMCSEEKRQGPSAAPVNVEGTDDEGAVYIDASGRKLRILSKFNVSSVSEAVVNHGSCKLFKGGKGSKVLSTNKKKHQAQKHKKYLKLATRSKYFCSLKPHRGSQIRGGPERNFPAEENHRKGEHLMQSFKAQEQTKPSDLGTIRKWVCSKRTGLSKKVNCKEGLQRLGYNLRQEQDLISDSDPSSLGDSYVERSCVLKTPNSSESPPSSPESIKGMENSSYEAQGSECNEQPPLKKRSVGFSSFRSHITGNTERSLQTPKCNAKQLRKDSTSVHDNCKGPPNYRENVACHINKPVEINAGPVKNTGSSRCSRPSQSHHAFSSKATRFPALRKNVLSVKQSSVPQTNYHLNRKCLSLKKSRVHGTAELDITDKMSLGRNSVLKMRKKRSASVSQREEGVALKSSHLTPQCYGHDVGEHLYSFTRVGRGLADAFDDKESVGEGVQTPREDIVIEPSSRIPVGESDMDLIKSSDPELHKLASPSYTRTESLHYVELYKGSFCGAEVPICLTEPTLGDGQEMFCADEVGNGMIGQSSHTGAELDSKVGQGNYYPQVDPIPIPGPPGSFLPSPRDMSSEDLQGNSSLTTSRVHSSDDHHDPVDGDSSDSPISGTSTISNSAIVRSDSKSSDKLLVSPPVAQDEIRSGFSSASYDTVVENTDKVCTGTERINLDELKVNVIVPKGPLSLKNDQPCCCSRKEGASQLVFNYQDSQLLRRRTMASLPLPDMGKQIYCDPNRRPNNLNLRPERFILNNFPSSGSEKVVLPIMKSAAGSIPLNVPADTALEFPIRGDCDSTSPSSSNPILRLMGKNLMVVNKDEDKSPSIFEAQSGALNDHLNPPFQTLSGVSPGIVQNRDFSSFHHMVHQGPLIFGQNQQKTVGPGFDVRFSFSSHVNSKTAQTPFHTPVAMFPSKNMGGDSMASMDLHEYKGGYNLPSEQSRSKNRSGTVTHHAEKVATTLVPQHKNILNSSNSSVKEIIIIDDTPESEANSATDATDTEGTRGSWVTSTGISIPLASDYNSRHVNPFHGYQPFDSSPSGVSKVVHNAGFQMPPFRRMNASPVKWNCTSEGSSVPHPSSLTVSSSSTGHLRSALYYSPSFS